MITDNPIGIIELGNEKINCLICLIKNNNELEILSAENVNTEGIKNGVIENLDKATNAVRLCISKAEKKADVFLKKINVVLEQTEFLCTKFSKTRKIDGSKIHKEDIDFLLKEAKKQVTLNDNKQFIIHIFNHNYVVDGKNYIDEPIDIYANNLSHEITFITMPKINLKNINQVFFNCDIEIERFISALFAKSAKLLDNKDLNSGSILIDLGLERTSLALFKNLALVNSITFPVGVNHIVKDVSKICSLSIEETITIINKFDFSLKDFNKIFDENNYLKKNYFIYSEFRKISKSLIESVVQARIDEIFSGIKKQANLTGFNFNSNIKLFITGQGSNLLNLVEYSSNFFGSKLTNLNNSTKLKNEHIVDDNFVACLGALKIIKDGWETEAIPEQKSKNVKKNSFFTKIFKIRA